MGIQGCNKLLWHAKGLTLQSLIDLNMGNRIDVDGNLMACMIAASGKKSLHEVTQEMALKLRDLAHCGGFEVQVIIDGDCRPDCKRASWLRKKDRELDDMNRRYCRLKAMELQGKINNQTASNKDMETYQTLNKQAEKLENKCSKHIFTFPNDFDVHLKEELLSVGAFEVKEGGGFVKRNILKARFQADSLIASRFNQNKCDFILSSDKLFPIL